MRKMDRPKTEKWGISADLKSLSGGKRNHTFRTDGLEAEVVFKSTTRSPAAIAWLIDVHKGNTIILPIIRNFRHR